MSIAVWIVSGLLAVAFLAAGSTKLLRPKAALQPRMGYVEDLTTWQVKVIGALEILGAIGLIVPVLTGIAPILTPIAAACLAVSQAVAFSLHVRRKETKSALPTNGVLFVAAVFVAVTRFLGY
jgi:uncharacterized membrane protein